MSDFISLNLETQNTIPEKLNKEFRRGEIWRFDPDPTKGREQAKVRPCLIISSNQFNLSPADLLIILPITSKNRGIPSHIPTEAIDLKKESYIMCEQIRSVSKQRIFNRMGTIDDHVMKKVEYWLSIFLDISNNI